MKPASTTAIETVAGSTSRCRRVRSQRLPVRWAFGTRGRSKSKNSHAKILRNGSRLWAALARSDKFLSAWMSGESQICNPWHVKALIAACEKAGVELLPETEIAGFESSNGQLESIIVGGNRRTCDAFVFACGAWTGQVTSPLVDCIEMVPVRGQMILYRLDIPLGIANHQ